MNKPQNSRFASVLMAQAEAWNRGDIPAFMQGYLRDENLRFASGDTVQRGWQQTLERYQKHYDTREKMGTLSFRGSGDPCSEFRMG
jgi:beta-aspartyl-peptidase (threonine type)